MSVTYLTFDIGTTALKTALISEEGIPLAVCTREYTPLAPQPDWAEMGCEGSTAKGFLEATSDV